MLQTQLIVKSSCSSENYTQRNNSQSKSVQPTEDSLVTEPMEVDAELMNGRTTVTRQNQRPKQEKPEYEETRIPFLHPDLDYVDSENFIGRETTQDSKGATVKSLEPGVRERNQPITERPETRVPFHVTARLPNRNSPVVRPKPTEPTTDASDPKHRR